MEAFLPRLGRMASKFSQFRDVRAKVLRILLPRTKWGRATVWLGVLSLLLWTARLFGAKAGRVGSIYHPDLCFLRSDSGLPRRITARSFGGCVIA